MQCASGSLTTLGHVGALRLSERTAAIRSTAGAPAVRLRACGRLEKRTTSRSYGGGTRPGLPRASSGSTPDPQSVTKRAKSNLDEGTAISYTQWEAWLA